MRAQRRSLRARIGALPTEGRPQRVRVDSKPSRWQRFQTALGAVSGKPAAPPMWRDVQEAIGAVPRVSRPSVESSSESAPAHRPGSRLPPAIRR